MHELGVLVGHRPQRVEPGHPRGLQPPDPADRDRLHAIIYDELVVGVISEASKAVVLAMIEKGRAAGADGIIFGCTEIGLLLDPAQMPLPTVDTAVAHCEAAVAFALG